MLMGNRKALDAFNGQPPPRDIDDAIARLMSVLLWLDSSGRSWAALDVNNALEKLLSEQ